MLTVTLDTEATPQAQLEAHREPQQLQPPVILSLWPPPCLCRLTQFPLPDTRHLPAPRYLRPPVPNTNTITGTQHTRQTTRPSLHPLEELLPLSLRAPAPSSTTNTGTPPTCLLPCTPPSEPPRPLLPLIPTSTTTSGRLSTTPPRSRVQPNKEQHQYSTVLLLPLR